MKQLTGEYTDATAAIKKYYENLETYSLEEKQLAEDNAKQAMALEQKYKISSRKEKLIHSKSMSGDEAQDFIKKNNLEVNKDYTYVGTSSERKVTIKAGVEYEVTEEKSIAEVIAEKIGNTDSTQVTEALNQ